MASQETPNYRLSRWAGTDRILVEEFNDNWEMCIRDRLYIVFLLSSLLT